MIRAEFVSSISLVKAADWDALVDSQYPFMRHAFLEALETSACVSPVNGWTPLHLLLIENDRTIACMPLYLKTHSYGEFVFDGSWAQAYEQHGFDYFPKLLTAVPFSPVTGPRAGMINRARANEIWPVLLQAVVEKCRELGCSGWHLLFSEQDIGKTGGSHDLLARNDVQFHWQNRGYSSFSDFLGTLKSSRRKNVRRERKRIVDQNIRMERRVGAAIDTACWDAFYQCYQQTYLKRSGHSGYLNRDFFDRLAARMGDSVMIVTAQRGDEIVGSSLFLFDDERLYGRYWGALQDIDCLHFECCFYQGIEFCIEHNLKVFDPGTQGEHKLLRGFEPVRSRSFHWLAHPDFRAAIKNALKQEPAYVDAYADAARELLPFRQSDGQSS